MSIEGSQSTPVAVLQPRPKIVVMKFGGTSVEDAAAIKRTAAIVKGRRDMGHQPIVVVSAMARVTDQLLAAAAAAGRNDREAALSISFKLRERHLETASELVGRHIDEVAHQIHQNFDSLDDLLRGIAAVGELTPRTNDLVVSFGERLSSMIVAHTFEHRGLAGAHIDARTCIITDSHYGKAAPNEAAIEAALHQHLLPLVEAKAIPVLGGFIGSNAEGITTTLGRGGSDYTAALVGGGLHAGAIEIWTDVNGIMTTDPRIVPEALRVKTISFEEAAELAYFGAKVLHPATILPAVQKSIPVWVLNSRNAANEGTKITAVAARCASPFKSIAAKKRLTIIDIVASRMLMAHGFLKAVFDVFDKYSCAIDMVSTSEVSISLTVDSNEQLPAICAELGKIADVKYEGRKALICLVGEDIRGHNGIAGRVFTAVSHVNVRMISQGASEINMSFMIDEEDVEEAVRSLHKAFFTNPDETVFDVASQSVSV
ncbi:lysine-sensitive aspartokinase 3 [Granulicella tundricola]|uniref:Aspartokinase n=1 Tax=Granulicella tundricola (strain ATCC BAA-1859 / DSM 23138 / MP5ACTX9) TaxID=1198114 RepID=E8WZN7_GRATM|nr:lysine-sensitive aspartokinase 3 [Granulicella tundricola]ADW70011.1 aspartate kinase [Granulicella tundricola MP5ACTX9]